VAATKGSVLAVERGQQCGCAVGPLLQTECERRALVLSGRLHAIFGAVRTIGLAFDLVDDGSFHQAIEESHGNRVVGQIISPFVEVAVGHQGVPALLVFERR